MKTKTCTGCGGAKAVRAFPEGGDTCVECRKFAEGELETRDLTGVELMSEGGPYFGVGSPPGGDYYDRARLEAIAEANRALADEVVPPNKLGHGTGQALLRATFGEPDDGELPAAGWLDGRSFRVEDRDGVAKLIADVRRVPGKLAKLFEAGAFRKRSVELKQIVSQSQGGKVYEQVVTGLAWLGAKAPAIRTLDDVIALYSDDEPEAAAVELLTADEPVDDPELSTVDFAEGDVIWNPGEGMNAIRAEVERALNPAPPGAEPAEPRFWVQDVAADRALVGDWRGSTTWVVPLRRDEGGLAIAPADEWTLAEQAWVEVARDTAAAYQAALAAREATSSDPAARVSEVPADTRRMKLSDEQIQTFAEAFGIVEADDAKRRDLVLSKFAEAAGTQQEPASTEPETTPATAASTPEPATAAPAGVSLSEDEVAELKMQAQKGEAAYEAARVERRDNLIQTHVSRGALDPAKVDEWRGYYDANPDLTTRMLSELPVNDDLVRAYGSDGDGDTGDTIEGVSYEAAFETRFGQKAVI